MKKILIWCVCLHTLAASNLDQAAHLSQFSYNAHYNAPKIKVRHEQLLAQLLEGDEQEQQQALLDLESTISGQTDFFGQLQTIPGLDMSTARVLSALMGTLLIDNSYLDTLSYVEGKFDKAQAELNRLLADKKSYVKKLGQKGYDKAVIESRQQAQSLAQEYQRLTELNNEVKEERDKVVGQLMVSAARLGLYRVIKLMLESGADANLVDQQGVTMLSIALERDDNELFCLLLGYGADVAVEVLREDDEFCEEE
ncbi:MAG: ankyrin repeat domain-containing protein [Epsilonproteobacteria bacterium]|nr:ankyrin repeat domain-containing protein [Campylobacterota bacterium]